jgi:23S rRNA (uracil1939-C5)-methyltransferase
VGENSIVNDVSGSAAPQDGAASQNQAGETRNPSDLGSSASAAKIDQGSAGLGQHVTTIDKWVYGGEGLARIDGRVVLVSHVLPGETVRISAGEDIRSELLEVVTPAPERVTPPCSLFAECGGCHYQHAPYEFQLARKVEILREQLRRVGKIDYADEIEIVSGPPLGYRNRVQFHIVEGHIGYVAPRSHELIPVTGDCPIASPKINQTLADLRVRMGDRRFPRFLRSLEIFTNETEVQINIVDTERPVAQSFFQWTGSVLGLDYPTSVGTFRVSPKSFFQVNRFLIEKLMDVALDAGRRVEGQGGSPVEGNVALDLYAGVGLFAIPLASRFKKVIAVESGSNAVRDLEFNAKRSEIKIRAERVRVEDYIAQLDRTPDFVLADPPRSGLGKQVVSHLERLAPPRITIVSCDPATLARDLAGLKSYQIEKMTLVDLFPQTYHMETVVRLVRK